MERKPIQIATSIIEGTVQVVALCNDGTMWVNNSNRNPLESSCGFKDSWVQLKSIPQPSEAKDE